MLYPLLRTLIKIVLASLVAGATLTHFGITAEQMITQVGLSQEQIAELLRQALAWALPNVALGAMVIVPVWFLAYLLRPPRRSSD
jgi:acetyl-CoA acetyltransferase